ncbi:MAG: ankyrin repeat domain-containing protein [Deltaproteobacteria bacterium]|nr:ankyrin repeat domain-containing protein [Deltaproteobacteria bacterium]
MAEWWSKLKRWISEPSPVEPPPAEAPAKWVPADSPNNPFGMPILNLMVTQTVIATSKDPKLASRSISWGPSLGSELELGTVTTLPELACALSFPAEPKLGGGLLFTPSSMDQKWVIAWNGSAIIAARSWTGAVEAIAKAQLHGDELRVFRLQVVDSSPLRALGNLPETFEWLIRSHALGEELPFPAHEEGAQILEQAPLSAFSAFGNVIRCAAKGWRPPPPRRPLRSNGRALLAAQRQDLPALREFVAAGDDLDVPGNVGGYNALHWAVVAGDLPLVQELLSLGADPNRCAERGANAMILAVVHRAPVEIMQNLAARGADTRLSNEDGFNALHAAAEANNPAAVPWLLDHGLELEARTQHGHTALQVACALGHLEAAKALVARGADRKANSPQGDALEIAQREGQRAVEDWLVSLIGTD